MAMKRLAPGSVFTEEDQKRWYAEQKGYDRLVTQVHLANIAAGRCSCEAVKLTRTWEGNERPSTRTVHRRGCAKFKNWMGQVQ